MKTIKLSAYFLIALFISLSGFKSFEEPSENEIFQLGNNRELFVDHYLIDKLKNAHIVMHRPFAPVFFTYRLLYFSIY